MRILVALSVARCQDLLVLVLQDYDEQADVWSVGILMWQLLTGRFPFWDDIKSLSLQQARCRAASIEPSVVPGQPLKYPKQDEQHHCMSGGFLRF